MISFVLFSQALQPSMTFNISNLVHYYITQSHQDHCKGAWDQNEKKAGLRFLSLKNKQPQVSLNLRGMRKKGRGVEKKKKFLLSPIPSPFSLLSPSSSDVGVRNLRRGVFERRTSTGSGLFFNSSAVILNHSWANRLYKSKDTQQYKFGSAKAY